MRVAQSVGIVAVPARAETLIMVAWGIHGERLPQKQGLCQVVNAPDFGTLSDF
jgi:hypothetical protein